MRNVRLADLIQRVQLPIGSTEVILTIPLATLISIFIKSDRIQLLANVFGTTVQMVMVMPSIRHHNQDGFKFMVLGADVDRSFLH